MPSRFEYSLILDISKTDLYDFCFLDNDRHQSDSLIMEQTCPDMLESGKGGRPVGKFDHF